MSVDLTPTTASWTVPTGFATYEASTYLDGPVLGKGGKVLDNPQRKYRWGIWHIYDDGSLRIVVRPGNRENYVGTGGWYMEIESMAGNPGQTFSNVHAALAEAARVVGSR